MSQSSIILLNTTASIGSESVDAGMTETAGRQQTSVRSEHPAIDVRAFLRPHVFSLGVTWALFVAEQLLRVANPLILARVIAGTVEDHSGQWVLVYGAYRFLFAIVSFAREAWDTRAYCAIRTELTTQLALGSTERLSVCSARARFTDDLVNFMERELPMMITVFFSLATSVLMLLIHSGRATGLAVAPLTLLVPLAIWTMRQNRKLTGQLHDAHEEQVDVLGKCHPQAVASHFQRIAALRIRLSDLSASNRGLIEILMIFVCGLMLNSAGTVGGRSVPDLLLLLGYLTMYTGALCAFPTMLRQYSRLLDILKRISPQLRSPSETR